MPDASANRGLGWVPDVPAPEDHIFGAPGVERLDIVDLRPGFRTSVEDQTSTNSCVANASASALEFVIAKENKDNFAFQYPELSRKFAYYNARVVDGLEGVDLGSSIRSCVDQLRKVGVCEEALFPFDTRTMQLKPQSFCYDEAARHRVLEYSRLLDLDTMLDCLSDGYPFIFGFQLYREPINEAGQTGHMPMPSLGDRKLGGHAVLAVGYDLVRELFTIRNSYGTRWGNDGYYTMPFEYVVSRKYSSDHWTLRALAL